MRPGPQALLPFVALVVGFVAGTGFGVVVLSDPPEAPLPATAAAAESAARGAGEGAQDEPAKSSGTRRRGVSRDDVLVENALRGTGDGLPTRGDGVVTGTVRDASGTPLEGVEVAASTSLYRLREQPPGTEGDSLEAQIRRLVAGHRFAEATRTTATTAADGTYAVQGLVEAEYGLQPRLAGWRFEVAGHDDWEAGPGETLDFVAHPVVGVAFDVRMPDGSMPDDVDLRYSKVGSNSTTWTSWSPDDDPLELGVGIWSFSATGGPHDAYSSGSVEVEVTTGDGTVVELQLAPRPGIVGSVEFTGTEKPVTVGLAALSLANGDADESRFLAAPHRTWLTDPYEFRLLDLESGAYLVGVLLRNGVVLTSSVIDVGNSPVEHTFSVGAVDVRDYVVVRARAPDGSPVTDVTFSVGYDADDSTSFEGQVQVEPEADGSYRVPYPVPGGPRDFFNGWSASGDQEDPTIPPGLRYYVTASSPRFGSTRVEMDPGRDREVDLQFREPAYAVVTVAGYGTSPWRGKIEAYLVPTGPGMDGSAPTWMSDDQRSMSPEGVARVGPVAPGTYMATLMVLSEHNGYREVARTEVVLGTGDTPVTLSMPDLHELVMVVDGEQLDLDLHRDPRPGETTDFLEEGIMAGVQTTFAPIAPGRYRVRHFGDGSTGEMLVDVPTSGPVRFRATPYDSLRVESLPETLVGLLEQGDVIVRIGDGPMDGERRVRASLAIAQARETVSITVQRRGRTFDVDVPSAALELGSLVFWTR